MRQKMYVHTIYIVVECSCDPELDKYLISYASENILWLKSQKKVMPLV